MTDDDQAAAAHHKAMTFFAAVYQPGDLPATNLAALLCEARDALDYGEPIYAEALAALAMRLATDLRAAAIAAAD